jgi:MFS family permease
VDTFGWVLGPVWGAAISSLFGDWRAIFWLNIPLGLLAALALLFARPALSRPSDREAPNLLSAVLGVTGLVAATIALSSGGEAGLSAEQGSAALGGSVNPVAAYRWPLLGVAALALAGFVISEWRARSPLLPRDLIRSRLFQLAGGANLLVGAALIVAMVNAPLTIALLADQDEHSRYTALILGSFTLLMTLGAFFGGRAANRVDGRWVAVAGLLIGACGFALMSAWSNELELAWMSVTVAIAGLGLGIVIAPIAEAAIRAAGTQNYGAASGLVLLARLIGMTVGLAGVTSFALERLDERVSGLPSISPNPGESATDYFARQQDYLQEQLIPLTLDVVHETFLVAALICLLTIPFVLWMRQRRPA